MAWTTPRTWTIAEFVTKSILDTHIRDNLNALRCPTVHVGMSAAQNHTASGSYQTVGWDIENADSFAFHDNVTNNSRLTVPSGLDGVYLIFATIAFSSSASNPTQPGLKFQKNGGDYYAIRGGDASIPVGVSLTTTQVLVAGDYITVMGFQNSGGTAAYQVGGAGESCQFGMTRLYQ
jgi:hypothetical protein